MGQAAIFGCPSRAALKRPNNSKKKKSLFALGNSAISAFKKNVNTSKVFQFQLTRKASAKIDAPEHVQAEQLWDLDGGSLIQSSCVLPAEKFMSVEMQSGQF